MSIDRKRNVYKGLRYVPLVTGVWDQTKDYEGLTVVTWEGASYTSKKHVPAGIDILDEEYWVVTGNYNAQVENYRQEVRDLQGHVDDEVERLDNKVTDEINAVNDYVNSEVSVLQDHVNQELSAIQQTVNEEVERIDTSLAGIDKRLNPLDQPISADESRTAFIQAMNQKAKDLGMNKTTFKNPSGLYDADQVTTARDMLLLGLEALNFKELQEAWGRKGYTFQIEGSNKRNEAISTTITPSSIDDNYTLAGGKTGTLSAHSHNNLMAIGNTKFSPNWFLSVVLGSGASRYTSTRELFDIANSTARNHVKFTHHDNNLTNGNFDQGLNLWDTVEGIPSPVLDRDEWFTFPQSLKCHSKGESRYRRRWILTNAGDKYYISAMVKVDRYKAGEIGLQFTGTSPSTNMRISKETDGWVLVSAIVTAQGDGGYINIGATGDADLDGWVDNVNVINLTTHYGVGNEPSKSYLDSNYWRNIGSQAGIVVNVPLGNSFNIDNLNVIFEKNANEVLYPASITKVMTAILLLEHVSDLSKKVEVIQSDLAGGSGIEFYDGDIITLKDALYLLMLPSSNTVANTVARIVGRKIALERV